MKESVTAGAEWIAEMLFMLFFAYIVVCNGPNIALYNVYEAYWLMDFPLEVC